MFRRVAASIAFVPWLLGASPIHAQAAAPCQFILGFKTLHGMDSADVGDCIDNQAFAGNGDAQQHTTNGLMAWRKADNWTAFTNGYWTWINGPNGLAKRLNTQRFSWEANPDGLPIAGATAAAVPAPVANGLQWAVALDHTTISSQFRVVGTDGTISTNSATGQYLDVFFRLRNNGSQSAVVNARDYKLTDAQGRSYASAFQAEEVNADGSEGFFDGSDVTPGGTVTLDITFDVAKDATGLVMHLQGGNDLPVK